ncbi:hypothetical protein DT035_12565 [Bacillus subtilis]|uniref:hypothetical protein n=1 Tax=Bacillus subtilis TaxID=1423 RepID=UPI0015F4537C|nr:hypothetical protein [Bacillus subtilis]
MFVGYKLSLESDSFLEYRNYGNSDFESYKKNVEKELDLFINEDGDGSISGSKLQDNWFPEINADIFLSHSHADKEMAIALAGWLKDTFNLTTFIDSCVWGYADDLLKKIDNKYCKNQGESSYNYDLRNHSTSHVHMMLSTALTKMIDKTECVIFLNTPNSIENKDVINQTKSPWIFLELAMTELIRKTKPDRLNKSYYSEIQETKNMVIKYDVPTEHLYDLNIYDLDSWAEDYSRRYLKEHALDILYKKQTLITITNG